MQPHSVQPYFADDALQVRPRDLVPQPAAVVGGDELVELVGGQAALAPDVAEFEARVVVAGVLVVDDPHPVAVFDEVARQADRCCTGRWSDRWPSAPV